MDVAQKIEARMNDLGMNPASVSKAAGLPRDAVRDILTGRSKNPRTDTLQKVAAALQVRTSYLLPDYMGAEDESGEVAPSSDQQMLPVKYETAGGRWLAVDEIRDEPYGYETALRIKGYENIPQWLERVRGDSVNRRLPDGALAHVLDAVALEYEPKNGNLVVVVRTRAQGAFIERSIKEVVVTSRGVELWPRSFNPEWDKPLHLTAGIREGDDVDVNIVGVVFTAYIVPEGGFPVP